MTPAASTSPTPSSGKIYRWNDADKKADVLATISGQHPAPGHGLRQTLHAADRRLCPGRPAGRRHRHRQHQRRPTQQPSPKSQTPKPGTALLLPVGLHNRMDIMQEYIKHRGYQYPPEQQHLHHPRHRRTNTAATSMPPTPTSPSWPAAPVGPSCRPPRWPSSSPARPST